MVLIASIKAEGVAVFKVWHVLNTPANWKTGVKNSDEDVAAIK